jgi:hypothetical protein
MDIVKLFISAVLNPPSFNDWQSMNSMIDMIVTGFAFLFREVSIFSLAVAAVIIVAFVVTLIAQKIKSF